MRKRFAIFLIPFLALLFITWGCKKNSQERPTVSPTLPTIPQVNTAPTVNAGQDLLIVLPVDSVILFGIGIDAENNIEKYLWKQIYGPVAGTILKPNAVTTTVTNLKKGTYEFELTATDSRGLWTKDTVMVTVQDPTLPSQGEVEFKGLTWQCPMGCTLEITCLSCSIPPNKPYKVYVREGNTTQWLEVPHESQWKEHDKYVYSVYKDNLWIYINQDPITVPDVKIIY